MDERVSIAPMMEWTDPHYRALMRGFTRKSVLYTEMVVDDTIIHGPTLDFFIGRFLEEQPSVIQLGGHEPEKLAQAAEICEQYGGGYGEINLNCGCPSPRVAKRCFGAKLMLEPDVLREIVHSMQRRVSIPVTVKCRIGADDLDKYEDLTNFIRCASAGGARKFVIHARKCLLNGLSPKQNREIPPLRYETVHRLVRDFPELTFVLNGGINTFQQAKTHTDVNNQYTFCTSAPESGEPSCEVLPAVHGVMIGRAAYNNPSMFATADSEFYGVSDPCLTRRQVLEKYIDYCEWVQSADGPSYVSRGKKHMVTTSVLLGAMRNIMHGLPKVQFFRTALNDAYMEKLRGLNGDPNPSVRDVVSILFSPCRLRVLYLEHTLSCSHLHSLIISSLYTAVRYRSRAPTQR
jgi:tRNA-dihydrouridine synthase A